MHLFRDMALFIKAGLVTITIWFGLEELNGLC